MAQEISGSGLDLEGALEELMAEREGLAAPGGAPSSPPALRPLDLEGAADELRAEQDAGEEERLRFLFDVAQGKSTDDQAAVLQLSRQLGVDPEMVEENYADWKRVAEEAQFDPQRLREQHPGFVRMLGSLEPRAASTVLREEGWIASTMRRLAGVGRYMAFAGVENPHAAGFEDNIPSDLAKVVDDRQGLPTQADRDRVQAQEAERMLGIVTGPRQTRELVRDEQAAAGGTLDRVAASWSDARRGTELSYLGAELMRARLDGSDTYEIETRIARLELTPTARYYGQSWAEQPLIDLATLGASQLESLKGGGAGGAAGAVIGAGVGILSRNPGAAARLGRIGWTTGMKAGTAANSFTLESGGAFLDFRRAKTDTGEEVSEDVALGAAMAYGVVASALEVEALSSFLPMFGSLGDAVKSGGGKLAFRELLRSNPAFRTLVADAAKRYARGVGGEAKEEALQSIAQDLAEWSARTAQAGEAQSLDVEEVAARAGEAAGTALSGTAVMGAPRLAGATLQASRRAVSEHRSAVRAGEQVAVLAQVAQEQSPAVRAAPQVVAEMVQLETQVSGEPVTHLYVDAGAFQRLFQEAPDAPSDAPQQAARELLGEDGPQRLQEALATGARLEVPVAQYLEAWGTKQVARALERDTTASGQEGITLNQLSVAEALVAATTTRPGLTLPSETDPQLLQRIEDDARTLAAEWESGQAVPESSSVEASFYEGLVAQLAATRTMSMEEARKVALLPRAFVRRMAESFNLPADELFADYGALVVQRGGEWADQQFTFGVNAPDPVAAPPTFSRMDDPAFATPPPLPPARPSEDASAEEWAAFDLAEQGHAIASMERDASTWRSPEKRAALEHFIAYARGEVETLDPSTRRDVVRDALAAGIEPNRPDWDWREWVQDVTLGGRQASATIRRRRQGSGMDLRDVERDRDGRLTGRSQALADRSSGRDRLGRLFQGGAQRTDAAPVLEEAYRESVREGRAHVLYYRDPTTGLLGDRAMRDLPVDPERPNYAAITFAFKKPINDRIGHEALNEVYRAIAQALHAQEPLAGKVGGDFWLPAVRDQAELDAILERVREEIRPNLPTELQELPIIGAVAPRVEGEMWQVTVHRVGDTLGGVVDAARAAKAYPGREEQPAAIPDSIPPVATAEAVIADVLREQWASLSPQRAASDVFIEADPDGSSGVLTKAGWDVVRAQRPRPFVVSADIRAVAAMDKTLGHLPTDELIARIRRTMARLGGDRLDAAHVSGDEFMFQADSREDFEAYAEALRRELSDTPLVVVDARGGIYTQNGLHFAYGIAEGTDHAADLRADGVELPAAKQRDADAGRTKEHFAGLTQHIDSVTDDDFLARIQQQVEAALRGVPGRSVYGPEVGVGGGAAADQGAPAAVGGGEGSQGQRLGGLSDRVGALYQDDETAGAAPRGEVQFLRDVAARRVYRILLHPGSDRSTIIHELGHVFLDMFQDLASREDAPEQLKRDWATTLEWFGSDVVDRDAHERWARAWEAYAFEGKAPSRELRSAFARFSRWLRAIYRSIRDLRTPINDDIRGVFDRLLASEEETARARAKSGMMPIFRSPEDAGLSPEAWRGYNEQVVRSVSNAEQRAERAAIAEQQRELEAWWREERRRHVEQADRAYDDLPGVRAWRYLRTGEAWWFPEGAEVDAPPKLDRATVQRLVGADDTRRLRGMTEVGGVHPDDVAVTLGITSGQEMLRGMLTRPERSEWVRAEADRRMAEAHPDVLRERERLQDAAQEALHGDLNSDWLLREWAILRQRSGQQGAPPVESIRRAAQLLAERMRVRDVAPGRVLQQERSAAEKTARAAARGEWAQAYVYAQQRLLNHYLWAELMSVRKERDRFEEQLAAASNDKHRSKLGLADEERVLRDVSDTLAAWLGVRPRQEGERAPSMAELSAVLATMGMEPAFDVARVEALLREPPMVPTDMRIALDSPAALRVLEELYGPAVALAARSQDGTTSLARIERVLRDRLPRGQGSRGVREVREQLRARNAVQEIQGVGESWTYLSVSEMRELGKVFAQLDRAAIDAREVMLEDRRIGIETLSGEILGDALQAPQRPQPPASESAREARKWKLSQKWEGIRAAWLDPEEMFRRLGATATRFFWGGYLRAREREQVMAREVLTFFAEKWDQLPAAMQRARYDLVDASALPIPPTVNRNAVVRDRQWAWMVGLNMGNASNEQRLLDGYGWTREQVVDWLDKTLTREEWEFIQGVWDLLDRQLYPEVASTFERVNGIRPEKIPATPIRTRHGTFRGGYFPARYDAVGSNTGRKQDAESAANLYADPAARASVSRSFTKGRAEVVKDVISLQWATVPGHVSQVIHYVTHAEFVQEAARVLANPNTVRAAQHALGLQYERQIQAWLKVVATARMDGAAEGLEALVSGLGQLRGRFVVGTLGWNIANAMGDLTNPMVAVAAGDVRARYMGASLASLLSAPRDFFARTGAASAELRGRRASATSILRRELGDVGAAGGDRGAARLLRRARETAFFMQEALDELTSSLVWEGAYRQGLSRELDESAAIAEADATVRRLFPGNALAEQPAALRDKSGVGSVLAFFSYFSKVQNRLAREWHGPMSDWALARDGQQRLAAGADAARAAGRTLAVLFVMGPIAEMLSGRGPEDDEEPEEWALRKTLSSVFGMVPLFGWVGEAAVGHLVSAAFHGESRQRSMSARAAPVVSLVERVAKAIERASTSDDGGEAAARLLEALLAFLGVPTSQPVRTGRYLVELVEGTATAENPADVVSGVIYGERERQPANPASLLGDVLEGR